MPGKLEERQIQVVAERAVVVNSGIVTAYGRTTEACWDQLLQNKTMVGPLERVEAPGSDPVHAATVPDLFPQKGQSFVMKMLDELLDTRSSDTPDNTDLILATTVGEIEFLEQAVLDGTEDCSASDLNVLLGRAGPAWGVTGKSWVVSSACASSTIAIALGADAIRAKRTDSVLVLGCDSVSEFVVAGFSALGALDSRPARPFDVNRQGLSLGEAAGYVLLMSASRAAFEGRSVQCEILGSGISSDASHMTRPTPDGLELARAIGDAIARAGVSSADVSAICAHGTGTVHNDSMEMAAFKSLFKRPVPTFSIKGGTGHTLGAAGLIETVISARALRERRIPLTVGTETVAPEGAGWIMTEAQNIGNGPILTTNSGFVGVNACLLLGPGE